MRGLFLHYYYTTMNRMRILLVLLAIIGMLIIYSPSQQFVVQAFIVVSFLSIILLSLTASNGGKKGWDRYEITLPVRRRIILMSKYLSFIVWVLLAVVGSSLFTWIVVKVKGGQYFDYGLRDILTMFFLLISLSLQICSFFYVGLYLFGLDKGEVMIFISPILSLTLTGIIVVNINQSGISIGPARIILLGISVVFCFLSYFIALTLYQKTDL